MTCKKANPGGSRKKGPTEKGKVVVLVVAEVREDGGQGQRCQLNQDRPPAARRERGP